MKAPVPQYQKIYNALLKKINKGEFSKEMPIPSENELSIKYEVSRMTARKSVDMLVNEGYLARYKGKGTFITGRKNIKADEISLTARLKSEDKRIYNEVISVLLIEEPVQELTVILGLSEENKAVWEIKRMRYVNDIPAIYETAYIPKSMAETIDETIAKGSLTSFVDSIIDLERIDMYTEPGTITGRKKAAMLGLKKGDAILIVKSILVPVDGSAALFSVAYQNTVVLPFKASIMKK
ncbi:MAG: GntR family transcriptional regulator [Clostridiaceae bacterium]